MERQRKFFLLMQILEDEEKQGIKTPLHDIFYEVDALQKQATERRKFGLVNQSAPCPKCKVKMQYAVCSFCVEWYCCYCLRPTIEGYFDCSCNLYEKDYQEKLEKLLKLRTKEINKRLEGIKLSDDPTVVNHESDMDTTSGNISN